MKALLGVMTLLFAVDFCWGSCFVKPHNAEIKNGKLVPQSVCIDEYDGSRHPIGSAWNTTKCMRCECHKSEMECCARYGGITNMNGCKEVLDEQECVYKFYKLDNPSEPCN